MLRGLISGLLLKREQLFFPGNAFVGEAGCLFLGGGCGAGNRGKGSFEFFHFAGEIGVSRCGRRGRGLRRGRVQLRLKRGDFLEGFGEFVAQPFLVRGRTILDFLQGGFEGRFLRVGLGQGGFGLHAESPGIVAIAAQAGDFLGEFVDLGIQRVALPVEFAGFGGKKVGGGLGFRQLFPE